MCINYLFHVFIVFVNMIKLINQACRVMNSYSLLVDNNFVKLLTVVSSIIDNHRTQSVLHKLGSLLVQHKQ